MNKGAAGGLFTALGATGVLVVVLLLVLRKGPFAVLTILLVLAVVVLILSVIQGFMKMRK